MIFALLLASAALPTAVDAERAFARDSQRIGQWTAFRQYADRDAVMFTPQAVWVQTLLKDRKDPPVPRAASAPPCLILRSRWRR